MQLHALFLYSVEIRVEVIIARLLVDSLIRFRINIKDQ